MQAKGFDDSTLRTIVELKLQGYANEEIAESVGCATRTIIRKLNRVRDEWDSDNLFVYRLFCK